MSQKRLKKTRKVVEVPQKVPASLIVLESVGLRGTVKTILRKNIWWLIAMTVAAFGIYFNSLWGGFVSDDYASITANPRIDDFWYMFNNGNTLSFSGYLIKHFFGFGSPFPFHLAAVLGFILFCWVAYLFLEIVFKREWLTRLTMLLFVVLPIHNEAVSWISGRNYVIVSIYVLIGFIGAIFYLDTKKYRYLSLSLVMFLLAFLTDKPRAFVLFLLVTIYLLSIGLKNIKVNWWKLVAGTAVLGTIFVFVTWPYIMNRINIVNSGYNASESIFYNPFYLYPTGVSKYLQLLWFPADLTLYHTMYILPVWLNWAIILTYLLAIVYFFFKNKPYFFALCFIMAATLPSMMPVKVSWLVAERYMFFGSLGFCLFLALIILDLNRYAKIVAAVLTGCLVVYYSVRLFLRNIDWQTNHNLWVNTCQVSPNSHNAWNNIGDDYDKLKDYADAVKGFTQSTLVKPNYADAYHNRANIFFKIGRFDLARESYGMALNFSPDLYQTYISLCQIDLYEKRYDLALAHAQAALKIDSTNPQAAYVAAVTYAQMGQMAEAETILEGIVNEAPTFQPAVQALQQIKMAAPAQKK